MRYSADLPANTGIRKILIVKWSAMGDVILATALMEDIAHAFPGRALHLNILPAWEKLFAADTRFSKVLITDLRNPQRRFSAIWQWLRLVRAQNYDLIIDLQCNDRSRLLLGLLRLSGATTRYYLGNRRRFPYNIAPATLAPAAHAIDKGRAALLAGQIPAITTRPVLHIPKLNYAHAAALLAAHHLENQQFAVFLPGSNADGYLKRWGAERYAQLAKYLHENGLKHIVLIGGADEVDECQRIAELCGKWLVNLCGQTAILDIPPLCAAARCIVANDTGTAHVAAVTTTPLLILCGPTNPQRVKPLGAQVATMQADLPCINCYQKTCSHHSCMAALTPQLVAERLQQIGALGKLCTMQNSVIAGLTHNLNTIAYP